MIEQILSPELVRALGWTLVHTLWQAALFALLLGGALLLLRKYSARARYGVAIGVLAAFFLTVALTFSGLYRTSPAATSGITTAETAAPAQAAPGYIPGSPTAASAGRAAANDLPVAGQSTAPGFWQRTKNYYNDHLPLIVTLWLMGVLILQLRFLGQLVFLQRLKNYGTERFPAHVAPILRDLEAKLGLTRSVRYLTSFRISSPFTAGWLQPAVLFPRGLLGELNEAELRTIIAHELAHIKRYDFLVNLAQTLLCILFFYHPAVWWISARIDEEREHCCDDLAIEATGEAVGYARTLLRLKEQEVAGTALAMGALGKGDGFKERITRLISGGFGTGTYGEGFTTAVVLFVFMGLAVTLSGQNDPGGAAAGAEPGMEERGRSLVAPPPPPPPLEPLGSLDLEEELVEAQARLLEDFEADAGLTPEQATRVEDIIESVLTDLPGNYGKWDGTPATKFDLFIGAILEGDLELVEFFLDREDFELDQTGRNDYTPLMAAAGEGHLEITRLLLKEGAGVDVTNRNGRTALLEAVDDGHAETVRLLIDNGANVNFANYDGWTPLIEAADEDRPDIARQLIAAGAEVNYVNTNGWTALIEAADEGSYATAVVLLEAGADPNLKGKNNGRTALAMASSEGHIQVFSLLVQNGADVFSVGGDDHPLHEAAEEGQLRPLNLLLDLDADPNVTNGEGQTPLHLAAEEGHLRVVERLLKFGADPNRTDLLGRTPLSYAAEEGQPEVVAGLLDAGATVNDRDQRGLSALDYAENELRGGGANWDGQLNKVVDLLKNAGATTTGRRPGLTSRSPSRAEGENYGAPGRPVNNGNPTSLRGNAFSQRATDQLVAAVAEDDIDDYATFLEAGADINGTATNGYTALTMASRERHNIDTERLIRTGADPNQSDGRGYTALTEAATHSHVSVVESLLRLGADVDRRDGNRMTALEIALRDDHVRLLRLLNDAGAAVTAIDRDGGSPLAAPARDGHVKTLQFLLDEGADPNGGNGCSPSFLAARENQREAIRLLAGKGANLENGCNYHDNDYFYRPVSGGGGSAALYDGGAPLMIALTQVNAKTVAVLLDLGADPNGTCNKVRYAGKPALTDFDGDAMTERGLARHYKLVYRATGWTALMEAVESGKPDLVKALLAAGADKNRATAEGLTALQLATDLGFDEIANLIR